MQETGWTASQAAYWSMFALHVTLILILGEMRWRLGMIWKWYKHEKKLE